MLKKNFLISLSIMIMMVLMIAAFPGATQAEQGDSGDFNFIFINYLGQEIVFDLDDVTHIIPGVATAPEGGKLALQLAPGEHKYAANAPGVPTGSAGEFTIEPGRVVAKAARIEQTGPALDNNGNVLEEPEDFIFVFDFDPFAAPVEETPVVDTWQPVAAQPGSGSLVWTNYYGNDELTIDLAGQLYKVPPAAKNIPGRLQIDVPPGFYRYTVSVPYGSLNGEITLVAGQVAGLNITADPLPEPEFEIGEPSPLPLPVTLRLFEEDFTGRATAPTSLSQPEPAPATLPVSGGERPETIVAPETVADGLLIKNYAGEAMVLTINHQTYTIPENAEQIISLPSGHYDFTASLPFVATTGTVDLVEGQRLELSIAINIEHDRLSVYQN